MATDPTNYINPIPDLEEVPDGHGTNTSLDVTIPESGATNTFTFRVIGSSVTFSGADQGNGGTGSDTGTEPASRNLDRGPTGALFHPSGHGSAPIQGLQGAMLTQEMARQGAWLFRWRSYFPLVLLPLALAVFHQSTWVNERFGDRVEELWDYACLLLAVSGLALRFATVGFVPAGTSGRSTVTKDAATLNTTGMYSIVRHPLYLGNFIVFVAFALLMKSLLFALFAAMAFFIYYERIMISEEAFLEDMHGERHRKWAAETPMFMPRLHNWVAPELAFSWRTALLREFHGVLLIGGFFFFFELYEATLLESRTIKQWTATEPVWIAVLTASLVIYLSVLAIKKRTRWLCVHGR